MYGSKHVILMIDALGNASPVDIYEVGNSVKKGWCVCVGGGYFPFSLGKIPLKKGLKAVFFGYSTVDYKWDWIGWDWYTSNTCDHHDSYQ